MSDVQVPFAGKPQETATLLLAAAEESGAGANAVRTGPGHFVVDEEIAKTAGVDYDSGEKEQDSDGEEAPPSESMKAPAPRKKSHTRKGKE